MKIKVHFEYEQIFDDVEKFIPNDSWECMSVLYKDGSSSFPSHHVTFVEVIDDEEDH